MIDTIPTEAAMLAAVAAICPCGFGQIPNDYSIDEPYAVIYQVPSPSSFGGMASSAEMGFVIYMVKVVALSISQGRAVAQRIKSEVAWATLPGVMGPPSFNPISATMEEGNVANINDNITLMIGG